MFTSAAPRFLRPLGTAVSFALFLALVGCGNDSKGGGNLLFDKESRVLAGTTSITSAGVTLELKPALEVRHTVQYVTLMLPAASQWRSGPERGALIDPNGKLQRVKVELEAESGRRFVLDSPAFGRGLMFSYVDPATAPGAPDLPKSERFVRLHLLADPSMTVDEIQWLDLTSK
jgi:hypothetical protein